MPDATAAPPALDLPDLDAAYLPVGHMRQISRVLRLAGPVIEAEVALGADHWVFPEHFPSDPIFPGALLIEAAGQVVALWAWANGQRGRPRLVRATAAFHHPVGPEALHIQLRGEVRRKRHLHFATVELSVLDSHVASVEAVLAVLPPA